jgi:peptide/nickel transport system substrate-binding protein
MSRVHLLLPISGVAASLVLTACAGGSGASEDGSRPITIALATEPNTLDGQRSSDGNARIVIQNIAEELVQRDPTGELIPGLAAELPKVVDDNTWQVEVREGVTFHNGEELDADLVVANLERAIDPDAGSENMDIVGTIESVKTIDDMTVEITTNVPDPLLPRRLAAMPIMAEEVLAGDEANSNLIGTGPYELVEWNRGQSIEIEAYDDYWGEQPEIKNATFRFIPDAGSQEAGLRAGEIDLITNLSPDSVDGVPQVFSGKSGESPSMILNTDEGVTNDVRVRQAMNMAVNQAAIAEQLFGGRAEQQKCQMSNPQLDHYNADLEGYPYDPERARELIKEAGAEGAQVEVVGTSGRWLRDRETTEAVGAAWREIGLDPKVQILEFNNYLDVLFERSEHPDSIYISAGNPMLSVQSTLDSLYSAEGGQGSNTDEEMARMVAEAATIIDPDERAAMLDKILAKGCEEAYFVFLPAPENLYGASADLVWEPEPDAAVRISRMSWK